LVYSASQPEELALVKALQKFGLQLMSKDLKGRMEFEVGFLGQSRKFRLLHLMDFTSDRKRMSVVIRDEQTQLIKLYTKGADSMIKERSTLRHHKTEEILDSFAREGLRTLLFAERDVSETELTRFNAELDEANAQIGGKEAAVQRVYSRFEQGLEVLGSVGILDKLQDEVPETV